MGEGPPRVGFPTQLVLRALLEAPEADVFGRDIAAAAGLVDGTILPILVRLEGWGWLDSRWEAADPGRQGRPARRSYRLTGIGARNARQVLAVRARSEVIRSLPATGTA